MSAAPASSLDRPDRARDDAAARPERLEQSALDSRHGGDRLQRLLGDVVEVELGRAAAEARLARRGLGLRDGLGQLAHRVLHAVGQALHRLDERALGPPAGAAHGDDREQHREAGDERASR